MCMYTCVYVCVCASVYVCVCICVCLFWTLLSVCRYRCVNYSNTLYNIYNIFDKQYAKLPKTYLKSSFKTCDRQKTMYISSLPRASSSFLGLSRAFSSFSSFLGVMITKPNANKALINLNFLGWSFTIFFPQKLLPRNVWNKTEIFHSLGRNWFDIKKKFVLYI